MRRSVFRRLIAGLQSDDSCTERDTDGNDDTDDETDDTGFMPSRLDASVLFGHGQSVVPADELERNREEQSADLDEYHFESDQEVENHQNKDEKY